MRHIYVFSHTFIHFIPEEYIKTMLFLCLQFSVNTSTLHIRTTTANEKKNLT